MDREVCGAPHFEPISDVDFARRVLDWVKQWLDEIVKNSDNKKERTRYENSLYGPVACILNSIFAAERQFKIKPQAVHRPHQVPESGDRAGSIDSYADAVRSRTMGRERTRYPDFLVAKRGIPTPHNPGKRSSDIILMVIEIKRDNEDSKASIGQLEDYLITCNTKRRITDLRALLIEGKRTRLYEIRYGRRGASRPRIKEVRCIDTRSEGVLQWMVGAAENAWNLNVEEIRDKVIEPVIE